MEAGEAKARFRHLAHTHAAGRRWILVGLGARDRLDPERARVAAAVALGRARELGARTLCWELPHHVSDRHAGALVEGTLLAAYAYTAWKAEGPDAPAPERAGRLRAPRRLGGGGGGARRRRGRQRRARPRQRAAQRHVARAPRRAGARARRRPPALAVEVMGREEIEAAGMGAFAAVARGADAEPRLITLTYEPATSPGRRSGWSARR